MDSIKTINRDVHNIIVDTFIDMILEKQAEIIRLEREIKTLQCQLKERANKYDEFKNTGE